MRKLVVFIGLLFTLSAFSQTKVDSLLRLCDKSDDIQKVDVFLKLSEVTLKDSVISRSYNKKAYQLAVAHNLQSKKAQSVYISAKINYTARNFTDAIRGYNKALELYRLINDTTGMTRCYRFIGISNFNLSRSKEAIASYLEGLKLAKRDLDYSAELLGNIGLVHNEMNNIYEAISYFRQAISINKSIRDTISMATDYDYLGGAYNRIKMSDSSLINYHKALYFFKKIKKEDRYAVSLSNLAWVLPNYPDSLNKAITYFNMAWKKFQELGWLYYEPNIQFGIANVYSKQGQLDKAIALYKVSIKLANQYKREFFLKNQIYRGLSETYQKKRDYKQALENHIIYSQYIDSVVNKQNSDQIANLEKQYETEKKEKEILQLQAKQELTNIQLKKNKQLKLLGFVAILLLLMFVFFLSKKYFDKIKLNQLLEEKNQQIEQSERELRLLNAAKNKFFSIIAHDLKNPFHTVMGFSYLLSKDYDRFSEKERRKFAVDIYQSTHNIFRLLENLLEWSKSQTGRLTFSPVETEFCRILENSTSVLRPLAEQKKIQLTFSCSDQLKVYVDPLMIETVLRNLINNAIKFTPKDGCIEIAVEQIEDMVRINVGDTGVGISEEDVQNLFHIDSKVKRKGTNNEDGSGLGLILCKEFVNKNNGRLWVESTPGKGSLFSFTIPVNAGSM